MQTVDGFKTYLSTTKMTFSYKPVLVLALLDIVDRHGAAALTDLVGAFHSFYLDRQARGLPSERVRKVNPSPMVQPDQIRDEEVKQLLLRYPLDLMKQYISIGEYAVNFRSDLWSGLKAPDWVDIREICNKRIFMYFEGSL